MPSKKSYAGLWIIVVAAVVLEAISCIQYFYSRAGIRAEAEQRAQSELRRAELEINVVMVEMEAAAKMLAAVTEQHLDNPDSVAAATRMLLQTIRNVSSAGIACQAYLFPEKGRWYEMCSSRQPDGSIYTRQIGGADHDYFQTEWYHNGLDSQGCKWSEPYMDEYGARTMVVSCTCPVRNGQGEVVAVACVDVSLNYLQRMSEYLQIYKDSYYSIRSGKGLVIVSGEDTVPGRDYQIYDEDIDKTGWKISIIIPEDVIFADLNRVGLIVGLLMALGLALLVFIVWYIGRSNKRLILSIEKNQHMENELHVARTIQMAMLPKVFPPFSDRPDLNLYGIVNPAKEVGGDLYDFFVRQDKLFFCVGDVSGKGVPAALLMVMTHSMFRSVTAHEENAAAIVSEMNRTIAEQNTENMFLTLFLGVLDCKTGRLDYCNAGHNAPVMKSNGQWKMVDVVANLPLGVEADFPYKAQTTQMAYSDLLFLYTDGLTEAENSSYEQYKEQRMLQSLSSMTCSRPREIIENMQASVEAFVDGARQSDDLTMFAIRYQIPAIIMRNDIQQIPTLAEWIDGLAIPDELNMSVNLALEEAVCNVMLYAYPNKNGQVLVEFDKHSALNAKNPMLIFTITDSGIPFDPTQQKEANITSPAEERKIGGLGIHLVRQLMDEIHYRREEDKNVLTLIYKRIVQ
ncbi:MAG: SpoIIE family protein phosphatase [Bacteroidales bacterium]|nr:SpoIIE family protein phosphatase [Bacteroidales bacterium]